MTNYLAIATVTATLKRTLKETVQLDVPGADVTAIRPDEGATGLPSAGLNLYLYQVTPNRCNVVSPPIDSPYSAVHPQLALNLDYLFTFYGTETTLEAQRVLESVVRTLEAEPFLDREALRATVLEPTYSYLAATERASDWDLPEEIEHVKITPMPLTFEELSQLWSILLQTTYTLCLAYRATAALAY